MKKIILAAVFLLAISFSAFQVKNNVLKEPAEESNIDLFVKKKNGEYFGVSPYSLFKIWNSQMGLEYVTSDRSVYVKHFRDSISGKTISGIYAKCVVLDKDLETRFIEIGTQIEPIPTGTRNQFVLGNDKYAVSSYCYGNEDYFKGELRIVSDGYYCGDCYDKTCTKVGFTNGETWEEIYVQSLEKGILSPEDFKYKKGLEFTSLILFHFILFYFYN